MINEDTLMLYEIIEKNKPKAYSEAVDQIVEMINKNREKSEKKAESRQRNKEKKGLLQRKDTAELERDSRAEKKKAGVVAQGKKLEKQGTVFCY